MTYRHFYDKDGSPLPGKSPVQVRVKGGPASSTVKAGINAAINAFLAGARISEASNLQKTVALPDGTTVRMHTCFGQVAVEVVIPPQSKELEEEEDFYGGIVIRPYCITNETEVLTSVPGSVTAEIFTLGEVAARGRPAVPTDRPSDPTTHLVVQIKNNVALDDRPVARGLVKIFRIKDPLVGRHAEISLNPKRYLVSAKDDFSEFYLCGKKLTRVPPLPETTYTLARIMAYGFVPTDFKNAAKAPGALFVAVNKKLYGLDAGAASPTWALLATASFTPDLQYANDFGGTPTVTVAPGGAVTLVCSGSNGAGVCSTFTGVITPGSPRPVLSGAITLMHDGTVPGVPQTVTYVASLAISGSNVPGSYSGAPNEYYEMALTRNDTRTVSAGVMPLLPDRFLGGSLPRYTANGSSTVEDWSVTGTFDAWVASGTPGVPFAEYHWTSSYDRTRTTLSGTQIDLTAYTWDFDIFFGGGSNVDTFSYTPPGAITKPPDQVQRFDYTATDKHTGKLAWRRDMQRSVSITPFPTQTAGGTTNRGGFPGRETVGTPATNSGSQTNEYSALDHAYELLRTSGTALVRYVGMPALFGTTPTWAQAYDDVITGGLKWAPLDGVASVAGSTVATIFGTTPPEAHVDPYYAMRFQSPVGVYSFSFTGPTTGAPFEPPYPGGSTFSYTLPFDGSTPRVLNLTDYAALFAPSLVDFTGSYGGPPEFDSLNLDADTMIHISTSDGTSLAPDSAAYCSPLDTGDLSKIEYDDRILFDIRSNGYIAWSVLSTEMVSGGAWSRSFTAVLGNDVSQVLLKDVIDEWRNLGTPDVSSDSKMRFYESPAEVSLL